MKQSIVFCALALLSMQSSSLRAADPLPPDLNLIPRDSALFISIRVADLWNNATLKPFRELAGNGGFFQEFEKQNGFLPQNVERITILIPTLSDRAEPLFVVTTIKPYDLATVLEAWNGYTEAEAQQLQRDEERNRLQRPIFKSGPSYPPKIEYKKPFNVPKKPDLPPMKEFPKEERKPFGRIEVSPPPREQNVAFLAQAKEEFPPIKKELARKRDLTAKYYVLRRNWGSGLLIPVDDRTVVIAPNMGVRDGGAGTLIALTTQLLRRQADGPLSMALDLAAGKNAVVLGANIPMIRAMFDSRLEMKMFPIRSFLAAKSAAMTLNFGDELSYRVYLGCADAQAAKKAKELLGAYLVIAREMFPAMKEAAFPAVQSDAALKLFDLFEKAVEEATVEVNGTQVEMAMKIKADAVLVAAVAEAVQKVQEAAARAKDMNNLKQMVLSAHNYASANQDRLPFLVGGDLEKKPNLSWRVHILPYIEQNNLYSQFHLDEPWDSDHNKKLIPLMPKIFEIPGSSAAKGQTYYRAFEKLLGKCTIATIPDGTSNTIMIFESAESTIWTKPDDLPPPYIKNMPKLNSRFKGGSNVAICDGSVRFISGAISARTLLSAFTPDGGEILGSDW